MAAASRSLLARCTGSNRWLSISPVIALPLVSLDSCLLVRLRGASRRPWQAAEAV